MIFKVINSVLLLLIVVSLNHKVIDYQLPSTSSDYDTVCVDGYKFVRSVSNGTLTQIFSNGNYVQQCDTI